MHDANRNGTETGPTRHASLYCASYRGDGSRFPQTGTATIRRWATDPNAMKPIASSAVIACLCLAASAHAQQQPAWRGHAGNAQHTAAAPRKPSKLARILWETPVDEDPQPTGVALLRHYGSPMITGSNTVLVPVKRSEERRVGKECRSRRWWEH